MTNAIVRPVREALLRAAGSRDLRRRTPAGVRYDATAPGTDTIYYLSPDESSPSGGIRVIYRHVDLLNAAGLKAAVLHEKPGFRVGWFANDTRVLAARDVTLGRSDLLVVPEFYGPGLAALPPAVRKVIFNQNAYQTFSRVPFGATGPGAPYAAVAGLQALLTVSEDNAALLRHAFPALPTHIARVVVDERVFHPGSAPAGRRIGYMPRRRAEEQEQLLHILRARGVLDGWELTPIDGLGEAQTAEALRGCAVFLSFSEREGFGLPPAEAMASGAYVVGFTGLAGRDFFDPAFCTPVAEADLLAFAVAVEQILGRDPATLAAAGQAASKEILSRYHEEGLRADLLAFYATLR
ncbi:glycosyltransferase family protein [Actinoplanes awajinensis]|uniref:Glycosyl transferase family 1 domain-containing protein n=1 Tax=Actinoplanes awajinensis subsp. mycoplanecinus TaxID=135947 RepID=A0A0X3V5E4_9ACTN|nr:glycosyltransferase [Actinoplanes awajinensis]KUL40013.1 hypothetical protein ADL15_08165 [Actinoplanes awajinensis subsp. mycoplanecinus]